MSLNTAERDRQCLAKLPRWQRLAFLRTHGRAMTFADAVISTRQFASAIPSGGSVFSGFRP